MKLKGNNTLLFEVGLVYTCTYNDSLKTNPQKCIRFYLPYQGTLNNVGPINISLASHEFKEVKYYPDETNKSYFYKRFIKTTVTCNTRDKLYNILNNMQGRLKQYGIQNYVSGTIYYSTGNKLGSVAISLSMADNNYSMWYKGQILVILARIKLAKYTIFVGNKEITLNELVHLLK